ncbi:hypothetical protein RN001_006839 [Aquatica leii]|uniref:Probable proline--tRNA ligase, mitochondrial n=1 Tax=Aquatica leii TaxID=1421715 RepID=A0AAN7Q953_9COLE|nr:hypothetical protein RN001_006839 [Aquatica leii]
MWAQTIETSKVLPSTIHKVSKIFQPINIIPKAGHVKTALTSKSQRLMLDLGIIRQASPGSFHFLPLGVRALEKLTLLVDKQMSKIGAQKVIFPSLTNSNLWKSTGRLQDFGAELFTLKDRHDHIYVLSPTHEEAVADLIASVSQMSYKEFPLKLYQTTNKYRDEIKPRFGLMRGRQFIMKDLYSFDVDIEKAKETYAEVCECYNSIFNEIGVDYIKVVGSCGAMGGSLSHEYHYKADIGEDKIVSCSRCGFNANAELAGYDKCSQCGASDSITVHAGIEVGHTFLLGDKYSKALNANYLTEKGKSVPLQMGSYGLGITRILAAAIEFLAKENEIRWPISFAPYTLIIIPPKKGSKEEEVGSYLVQRVHSALESIDSLKDNMLLDDRIQMTIGRRMVDARRVGYPYVIVIGAKSMEKNPIFELHNLTNDQVLYLNEEGLLVYLRKHLEMNK